MAHLVSFGHRAIGVVTDDISIQTSAERPEGYQRAMRSANLDIDPAQVVMRESTRRGGYAAAFQLLNSPDPPTAVFSTDNFMTEGVLGAARDVGLSIPQDIWIVGFDDFDLLTFVSPPITAVAQPTGQLGATAAELPITRLKGSDAPLRHIRLPTELIRRYSCSSSNTEVMTTPRVERRPGGVSANAWPKLSDLHPGSKLA